MEMKELKNVHLSNKYTHVFHDEPKFNAPHHFQVCDNEGFVLSEVTFQQGPINEHGVNGCHNEDLLVMVITRLEGFQNSEFRCRENAVALTKLEEALMWLRLRTNKREQRGVEGTHKI